MSSVLVAAAAVWGLERATKLWRRSLLSPAVAERLQSPLTFRHRQPGCSGCLRNSVGWQRAHVINQPSRDVDRFGSCFEGWHLPSMGGQVPHLS